MKLQKLANLSQRVTFTILVTVAAQANTETAMANPPSMCKLFNNCNPSTVETPGRQTSSCSARVPSYTDSYANSSLRIARHTDYVKELDDLYRESEAVNLFRKRYQNLNEQERARVEEQLFLWSPSYPEGGNPWGKRNLHDYRRVVITSIEGARANARPSFQCQYDEDMKRRIEQFQ